MTLLYIQHILGAILCFVTLPYFMKEFDVKDKGRKVKGWRLIAISCIWFFVPIAILATTFIFLIEALWNAARGKKP